MQGICGELKSLDKPNEYPGVAPALLNRHGELCLGALYLSDTVSIIASAYILLQ